MDEFWIGLAQALFRGLIVGLVLGGCLWLTYEMFHRFLYR